MRVLPLAVLAGICACHVQEQTFTPLGDGGAGSDGALGDGSIGSAVEIALPGVGSALWWDATSATLYLTDATHGELIAYKGGAAQPVAALPPNAGGLAPAGITALTDGALLITDEGSGSNGALDFTNLQGSAIKLAGPVGARRREGLYPGDGVTYEAFWGSASGIATITVTEATHTATESTFVIPGPGITLGQPIGIVSPGDGLLYVSDLANHAVSEINFGINSQTLIATPPTVDQLCLLPGGDVLTGGGTQIWRMTPSAGSASLRALPGTFRDVRGIAYDAAGQHLFLIDHDPIAGGSDILYTFDFIP
jgi:hypothetical protein